MKTYTFQITVTVSNEEFELLKKVAKGSFYNFDSPAAEFVDLCDKLRNRGLVDEDGNGKISINHRGLVFLDKAQ